LDPRAFSSTMSGVSRAGWTTSLPVDGVSSDVWVGLVSILTQVHVAAGDDPPHPSRSGLVVAVEANRLLNRFSS
jgi:hypothetical protein